MAVWLAKCSAMCMFVFVDFVAAEQCSRSTYFALCARFSVTFWVIVA